MKLRKILRVAWNGNDRRNRRLNRCWIRGKFRGIRIVDIYHFFLGKGFCFLESRVHIIRLSTRSSWSSYTRSENKIKIINVKILVTILEKY